MHPIKRQQSFSNYSIFQPRRVYFFSLLQVLDSLSSWRGSQNPSEVTSSLFAVDLRFQYFFPSPSLFVSPSGMGMGIVTSPTPKSLNKAFICLYRTNTIPGQRGPQNHPLAVD